MLTALIPYFDGVSDAARSNPDNRKGYLHRTLKSLKGFADTVVVGTLVEFPGEPQWLPARMFRHYQGKLLYGDFVYCTEADQVLTWRPDIVSRVQGDDYVVPWRYECDTRNPNAFGGAFLATVELFKKVHFRDMEDSPVEHTTGWHIAEVGNALRDDGFWVDHLSHREYKFS